MRPLLAAILALTAPALLSLSAQAQVSVGINIGVSVSAFPDLVPVPGYPVYYDPYLDSNYFFYDGQYWVYDNDNWYTSDWYNGPWDLVEPEYVPMFILRVPVRYYRRPPSYFEGWHRDAPPHWGEHWGRDWETRHEGWNHWNHSAVPQRAPLPVYQRQYAGDRYPHANEQHEIRDQHYHYRPHEPAVQHIRQQNSRQEDRQSDQRVNQPARRPADQPGDRTITDRPMNRSGDHPNDRNDSTRRVIPPPRSQTQPLPERPPDVQRPQRQNNLPRPPEELHRPPMKRPESPPPVHVERNDERRMERQPEASREHAPQPRPAPPQAQPHPHPAPEAKRPPHHDDPHRND